MVSALSREPAWLRAGLLGASKREQRAEAVTPGHFKSQGLADPKEFSDSSGSGENSCLDGLNVLERQVFESGETEIFPSFNR